MEYAYATCILNETGEEINETNLTAVLEAAGCDVQTSRVKAIVAALEDIDVDDVTHVDFDEVSGSSQNGDGGVSGSSQNGDGGERDEDALEPEGERTETDPPEDSDPVEDAESRLDAEGSTDAESVLDVEFATGHDVTPADDVTVDDEPSTDADSFAEDDPDVVSGSRGHGDGFDTGRDAADDEDPPSETEEGSSSSDPTEEG